MFRRAVTKLLPVLLGFSSCNVLAPALADASNTGVRPLHGVATKDDSKNDIPQLEQYGISCIRETNAQLPALVVDVKKGSLGETRGLVVSDRVISVRASKVGLILASNEAERTIP